jgi:hypothetical protein
MNTLEEGTTIYSPQVDLEEIMDDYEDSILVFLNSVAEDNNRLFKLRLNSGWTI